MCVYIHDHEIKKKQKTNLCCPTGISPMGHSGCLPWGKPAGTQSHHPAYGACWMFYRFRNPPNSDMDLGSLTCAQILMHAIALDTVRVSALDD